MPEPLANIDLARSWVLGIESDSSHVSFLLDVALENEEHAHALVRWCIQGEVWWNEGPRLDHPVVGASGAVDFGHIDVWIQEGEVDHLEGDWGTVAIRGASHSTDYLPPDSI